MYNVKKSCNILIVVKCGHRLRQNVCCCRHVSILQTVLLVWQQIESVLFYIFSDSQHSKNKHLTKAAVKSEYP